METPGPTGEGVVWDASLLEASHEAAMEGSQQQTADAVLSQFLQQQHQQAGLTSEQLAALAAAAAAGSYGDPTVPGTAAAPAGAGMAGAPTDITTLPPVPDLQGTTLAYLHHSAGAEGAAGDQAQQMQQLGEQQLLAAMPGGLAEAQQLTGGKRKADDLTQVQDGHDAVTDLLLAMAANQQDSSALRQLLAMQHSSGLHPSSTADAALAAAAAAAGQQLALPGSISAAEAGSGVSTVLAAPLALSLGAAGELPLLQEHNPAGGLQVGDHTGDGGAGSEEAAAAAASMQALQGLQFVQMPDGQFQALQSHDFAALLQHHQHQQQQLAMLVGAGSAAAAAAVPDAQEYALDGQQQHMHEPAAKRARTDAGGRSEDEAAELAELHQAAEYAAEAAVAAAAAAAASAAAAGEAAVAAAGGMDAVSSSAAEDAAMLAALQQLTGGTAGDLNLHHAGSSAHAALGTLVNIGGVSMLIPAATQLQLAALAGAGGGPDQQNQQDAQILALQQQQLQLAQLPLMSGFGGGLQHTLQMSGGSLGGSIPGSETDIGQLQMQQQLAQIQQLQQIQLMQLQLAAQQGMMLAPAGARGGLGGCEDGAAAAHMVRRHGVLPERLVTRDMLRQVFHLPIEEAAKQLGIGQTMLKHYCRRFSIPRWPYRKRQSVVQLIQSIENHIQGIEKPPVVEPALQKLRSFLSQIDDNPNVDLDGPIKRLRQAFFKEAYKARVRKQTDGDDGRSYSGRGGGRGGQRPDGWLENLCQAIVDSQPETGSAQEAGLEDDGAGDMGDGEGATLDPSGYQQEYQQDADAAAAAAAGGSSVEELAAMAALQQQVAAAPAGGSSVDALAAMAAASGSSVDELAAMAALQQQAASAGVEGHAGLLDPQVLAASMAAAAQLQSFQQGLQGLGAEGQGLGAAEQAALQAALQAGVKAD